MEPAGSRWAPDAEELLGQAGVVVLRWRAEPGWPIDSATGGLAGLGFATEEPAGGARSYARLIHPDDRARVEAEVDELARSGGGLIVHELRIVCPSGEPRRVEQRVVPRRDAAGRVTHFGGVLIDRDGRDGRGGQAERTAELTLANRTLEHEVDERRAVEQRLREIIAERERAEHALRESEERYRRIVDTSADGIWVLGPDGATTFVNARMVEMLGYDRDEMLGRPLSDFMFAEDAPDHRAKMEARRRGESECYERRLRRKDGRTVWTLASATPIFDGAHQYQGSFAMLTDITERKRTERALEEERRLFIGGPNVAMRWKAVEGWPVEYVSPNVREQFGYTPEQFTGGGIAYASIVHPDDLARVGEEVTTYSAMKVPCFEQEYRIARADGQYRWIYDFTSVIRDSDGTITYYHGHIRDITDRKRDEEALRRVNRDLRALSSCNEVLMRASDERRLLDDVCRIICDEAGYRLAWVGYAEHDGERTIRPVAWAGLDGECVARARLSWAADTERGRGHAGAAVRSGEVVEVEDVTTDPAMAGWREDALRCGYRSGLALPLKDDKAEVFGVLLVYSSETGAIKPDQVRLMEELAGDLAFGIGVLRARAEQTRAERSLALMSFALNHVREAAFLVDQTAHFHYVNEESCRILGYTREELLGLTVVDVDPDFPRERWQRHWEDLKAQGSVTIEGRHLSKDGRAFPVEINANYFEYGGRGYVLGLVRDITERKRAERERERLLEEVKEERRRLRVILDTAPVGISLNLPPDGRPALLNRAAEAILGRPPAGAGGAARDLFHDARLPDGGPFPPESMPVNRSLRGETLTGVELLVRRPAGRDVNVLANSAPIRDPEGRVAGVVVAFQDITPIREQERLRDEFIAAAAHELKTPVTTIKGYAELLGRWARDGGTTREAHAIDIINTQTNRINRRVQEMLEVVRLRKAQAVLLPKRLDLGELAAQVVERVGPRAGLCHTSLRREGVVPVEADRERIEEVLAALLDNAIASSPRGGDVEVRVWTQSGEGLVSVRDHGAGIPRERMPHVFEPFYEAVPPGAPGYRGVVTLSLFVGKLTIESHRGRIWLESEEGGGATFYFSLPLANGGADEPRA